jgi:hypothetical protein
VIPSETYPGLIHRLSPEDREKRRRENLSVLRGAKQEPARRPQEAPGTHSGSWLGLYLSPGGGSTLIRRFGSREEAEAWRERESALAESWDLPWTVSVRRVR